MRVSTPTRYAKTKLLETGLDVTEHGRETFLDVVLHGAKDAKTLVKNGFSYQVLVADLIALDRKQAKYAPGDGVLDNEAARAPAMPSGRVTYRHLWDFTSDMKMLAEQHPEFVKPITLSETTLEGRPIEGIEIANDVQAQDGRPVFLQMGVHHAREWPSAEMPMEWGFELVQGLVDGDERTTDLLSAARVIIVPVVNQDGFNLSRESMLDGQQAARARGRHPQPRLQAQELPYGCRGTVHGHPRGGRVRRGGAEPGRRPEPQLRRPLGWRRRERQPARRDLLGQRAVLGARDPGGPGPRLHPPGDDADHQPHVLRPRPAPAGSEVPGTGRTTTRSTRRSATTWPPQNGYTSQYGWELYDTTGTTEDWSYCATGGLGFTFEIGKGEGVSLTGAGFHPAWPVGRAGRVLRQGPVLRQGQPRGVLHRARERGQPGDALGHHAARRSLEPRCGCRRRS